MKQKLLFLSLCLFFLACQKDNEANFSCDVDYVEIIDASTARVVFEVSQDNLVRNYSVDSNYTASENNYVDAVPPHDHQAFTAQAERSLSGKGIGKWKIKQKRTISN